MLGLIELIGCDSDDELRKKISVSLSNEELVIDDWVLRTVISSSSLRINEFIEIIKSRILQRLNKLLKAFPDVDFRIEIELIHLSILFVEKVYNKEILLLLRRLFKKFKTSSVEIDQEDSQDLLILRERLFKKFFIRKEDVEKEAIVENKIDPMYLAVCVFRKFRSDERFFKSKIIEREMELESLRNQIDKLEMIPDHLEDEEIVEEDYFNDHFVEDHEEDDLYFDSTVIKFDSNEDNVVIQENNNSANNNNTTDEIEEEEEEEKSKTIIINLNIDLPRFTILLPSEVVKDIKERMHELFDKCGNIVSMKILFGISSIVIKFTDSKNAEKALKLSSRHKNFIEKADFFFSSEKPRSSDIYQEFMESKYYSFGRLGRYSLMKSKIANHLSVIFSTIVVDWGMEFPSHLPCTEFRDILIEIFSKFGQIDLRMPTAVRGSHMMIRYISRLDSEPALLEMNGFVAEFTSSSIPFKKALFRVDVYRGVRPFSNRVMVRLVERTRVFYELREHVLQNIIEEDQDRIVNIFREKIGGSNFKIEYFEEYFPCFVFTFESPEDVMKALELDLTNFYTGTKWRLQDRRGQFFLDVFPIPVLPYINIDERNVFVVEALTEVHVEYLRFKYLMVEKFGPIFNIELKKHHEHKGFTLCIVHFLETKDANRLRRDNKLMFQKKPLKMLNQY